MPISITKTDLKAIQYSKVLGGEMVENKGDGHPGTPVSLAPLAYLLYQKVMNINPKNIKFEGRDRFILSAGHASALQYIQLFFSGYEYKPENLKYEIEDLKAFRTPGSITPGHPEFNLSPGIEITTGPLGQGIASAVGFAMASKYERELLDPNSKPGESIFDHNVYVVSGDGCMQEGVASEASSFAGTQKLGNLILFYDCNSITIEDDISVTFNEDVLGRYETYGWHTQEVSFIKEDGSYSEDLSDLIQAVENAKAETDKPSIIKLNTKIAWPTPNMTDSYLSHGAAMGEDNVKELRKILNLDGNMFDIDQDILNEVRNNAKEKGETLENEWNEKFEIWKKENPSKFELYSRLKTHKIPEDILNNIPKFSSDKPLATRVASGQILNYLAKELPELWGGSADLGPSNNTLLKDYDSFGPSQNTSKEYKVSPNGRNIHFGIREFASACIVNGIILGSNTRAYCATFFIFSDYLVPAARLAALMKIPSLFIWTHDSVGVGEDGPTHQPIEQLTSFRAIPGFDVIRPCDANETAECYKQILRNTDRPSGIVLSRQNLPVLDIDTSNANKGAYIVKKETADLKTIIISTGSEVALALEAAKDKPGVRVVSMPCQKWFDTNSQSYKDEILPQGIKTITVEAGLTMPWYKYASKDGVCIGIDHFGAVGNAEKLFNDFGITVENIKSYL